MTVITVDFHKLPKDITGYFLGSVKDLETLKKIELALKVSLPGDYYFIQWTLTDNDHFFAAADDFDVLKLSEFI